MTDYKELIERLRYRAEVFNEFSQAKFYREAEDAIEELLESSKNFEELWQQSIEMRRELQAQLDTPKIDAQRIPLGER